MIYWYEIVWVTEETATIVNNYANEIDSAVIDSNSAVADVDVTIIGTVNVVDHMNTVIVISILVNDIFATVDVDITTECVENITDAMYVNEMIDRSNWVT